MARNDATFDFTDSKKTDIAFHKYYGNTYDAEIETENIKLTLSLDAMQFESLLNEMLRVSHTKRQGVV